MRAATLSADDTIRTPGARPAAPRHARQTRAAHRRAFWREAMALNGSVTPYIIPRVLGAGAMAVVMILIVHAADRWLGVDLKLEVAPHEWGGVILGLLLVLRTNAGYDRWWEARKLWGGIVNQTRNVAISGLSYGPNDAAWRDRLVRWVAAFPHAARASLRGEASPCEAAALVGPDAARALAAADHGPSAVSLGLARVLQDASGTMDGFAFQQVDAERAALMDHLGGCERILKTPLPTVFAIKIRRFIVLYLATLPLAVLPEVRDVWFVPLLTMMLAYPLFSLDQIGVELQNPFAKEHLSHLPLDEICATIERNVLALPAFDAAITPATAPVAPDRPMPAVPPRPWVREMPRRAAGG